MDQTPLRSRELGGGAEGCDPLSTCDGQHMIFLLVGFIGLEDNCMTTRVASS
jgi:hypothetical protein